MFSEHCDRQMSPFRVQLPFRQDVLALATTALDYKAS